MVHIQTTLKLAAVVLCFVASASSQFHSNNLTDGERIVGGKSTTIENVPWQVSIGNRYGNQFCGGAIVNEWYVITAAHCVTGKPKDLKVRTGTSRRNAGGVLLGVSRIVRHELFGFSTLDYDVGLIRLSESLHFGPGIASISLAEQDEPLLEGSMVQISGWGDTQEVGESSDILQEVFVPVFNHETCEVIMAPMAHVTERMFCAGYLKGGKDSCQGDSGGPAVMNGVLIGVVSWGKGCARPGFPGIYMRIAAVRDWIDTHAV